EGGALVELRLAVSEPHSKTLMEAVDWALRQASLEVSQLERLAVGSGPGSFSGLRIGMATMQGLAQALNLPLYTFVGHDLIAWKFAFRTGVFAVLTDARRQQIYWSCYVSDGQKVTRLSSCRVDDPEALASLLPEEDIMLVGSGVDIYRAKLNAALPEAELLGAPLALPDLGLLSEIPLLSGSSLSTDDGDSDRIGLRPATKRLEPLYIRPSDAELNRLRKIKEAAPSNG
ncbi:MAG: tRNA (adenosine(37)-N6)-threonylcarbamoyltransferase complex dimerization subunit type 1 TsaB, partial [Deltaproteobacteria bacterium]|nr:tRNA (adenosine(37)-N6)-threonylcarbamoyltransferase complex dimerization subunit type 1 TsaB [Deltaproteobacteria bacterium]